MPTIFTIDDVSFIQPVDVGSVVKYVAKMTYSKGRVAHVNVKVQKVKNDSNKINNSVVFELNVGMFMDSVLPKILPSTYREAMNYIEGKRRINKMINE